MPITFKKVDEFSKILKKNHSFLGGSVPRLMDSFGENWAADFEALLENCFPSQTDLVLAASGYSKFCLNSMRLQKKFEHTLEYPDKTHAQASNEVYFNEDHMMLEYLPGLLVSHYLWPHHYRQIKFFQNSFLGLMAKDESVKFYDVGVGTGIYSSLVLSYLNDANSVGVDISEWSLKFSTACLTKMGFGDRYTGLNHDILSSRLNEALDWIICVEVLEHMDDPVSFLKCLRENMTNSGRAFITAALNAAHDDHVYLYRTPNDVVEHLELSGFFVEQALYAPAYASSADTPIVPSALAAIVSLKN